MQIPYSITQKLTSEQLHFFRTFFSACPDSFAQKLMFFHYEKEHQLIHTSDSCSHVYILLKGRLQAIEERVADEPYHFTDISAIDIVGDYELFTETTSRLITLATTERSLCCVIPAADYLAWIRTDANALFIRIQMLMRQMSDQTQAERRKFLSDARTRLLRFLLDECKRQVNNDSPPPYTIRYTRPQIASRLGCSTRTVNRSILQLSQEGLITISHGKLQLSAQQLLNIQS